MRPIRRGRPPSPVRRYQDARELLALRLGDYCSYCERPTSAAVEHVLPWKNKHPRLKNSWNNLLLTCVKCNNNMAKRQDSTPHGETRAARRRYYWPDSDNTFRALEYGAAGVLRPNPNLSVTEKAKAAATLHILGLDNIGGFRSRKRTGAWTTAELHLRSWRTTPTAENLETIIASATEGGCWSVWRTVFAGEPQVLGRLDAGMPGTARDCFDRVSGAPTKRRKGQV